MGSDPDGFLPGKEKTVIRYLPIALFGLTLLVSFTACAPKTVGPTAPSGYVFSLQAFPTEILRSISSIADSHTSGGDKAANVVVRVRNRQGAAVDGIPVVFEVEPAWAQDATVTPTRAVTRQGEAHARFEARSVGVVRITARVEDTTQGISIAVSARGGSPAGGGAGGGP